ncbi:MAG: hypothetical protein D8M59_07820 [Planctomycetes bacterium]|nr:hypothetical protein [Planctomycetota bacterium]NOG53231.1 hypothetical protein [Planctomycetota bacterium]
MPIVPLPIFEKEADPKARGLTEAQAVSLEPPAIPESVVVRYGYMRQIAEYPFDLDFLPNCHTRLVVKSPRGTELADVLSRSCSSDSCGNVLTHDDIEGFIEQSGGRKYPFTTKGRVVRLATATDQTKMKELEGNKRYFLTRSGEIADELGLEMKFIEAEPILGEERLTLYFKAHDRVDFRELVRLLAREFKTRIEMRQVGARDEARLTADYERCGQHCCCRQFLKVLNRVPMRTAKVQKATLDPLKISGRCGRVMCCLLYEDKTYQELKKNLPHRKTRVGTADGPGIVIDSQIITQLVLVELEHDRSRIAVRVDELLDPETCPPPTALNGYSPRSSGGSKGTGSRDQKRDARSEEPKDAGSSTTERKSKPAGQAESNAEGDEAGQNDRKSGRKPLRRGRGSRGQSRSRRDRQSQGNDAAAQQGDTSAEPATGGEANSQPQSDADAIAPDSPDTAQDQAGSDTSAGAAKQDGDKSGESDSSKSQKPGRRRKRGGRGGRKSRGKRQGKRKHHRGGGGSGGGGGGGGSS